MGLSLIDKLRLAVELLEGGRRLPAHERAERLERVGHLLDDAARELHGALIGARMLERDSATADTEPPPATVSP